MVGKVDDPHFEEHLKEGPYVVFDDGAKPRYKNDTRVHFMPGHPVLRTAMPELLRSVGVKLPGELAQRWQQFERRGMHEMLYGSASRRLRAAGRPNLGLGLIALTALALRRLARGR
jgi:hypothetical protein